MAVNTTLAGLSQAPGSNGPDGTVDAPSSLDDAIRYALSFIAIERDAAHQWLTAVAGTNAITGTASGVGALVAGQVFRFIPAGVNTGAVTLNVNGLGVKSVTKFGASALTGGELTSAAVVVYDGTQFQLLGPLSTITTNAVRQTVLSGPVDSNGFAAFGGSTGATTVTAAGTLYLSAASGAQDRYGVSVNPSWTGLSTNGTMYLYLDIAADGSCTTGSTTLAPTYQWGGAYSTTSGQSTFNIQEMTMKAGNGATASQVWRVYVGQVTVAGAVVTAITWYALLGRFDSGWTATLPSSAAAQTTVPHRLGLIPESCDFIVECTTNDLNWGVGAHLKASQMWTASGGVSAWLGLVATRSSVVLQVGNTGGISALDTAGNGTNLTPVNWKYKITALRGW